MAQLYSGKDDPHKLHNVAGKFPAVTKDLQAKLDAYIASGWDVTRGRFSEKAG